MSLLVTGVVQITLTERKIFSWVMDQVGQIPLVAIMFFWDPIADIQILSEQVMYFWAMFPDIQIQLPQAVHFYKYQLKPAQDDRFWR